MSASPLTISFEWRIESPQGIFSGEQKALLVDKMEQIATLLFEDRAHLAFSYDTGSVVAQISAKINTEMINRAHQRAHDASHRGVKGLLAKLLLFFYRLGPQDKVAFDRLLAEDYLKEEKSHATRRLLATFQELKKQFESLDKSLPS